MQYVALGLTVVVSVCVAWFTFKVITFMLSLALGIIWNILVLTVLLFMIGFVTANVMKWWKTKGGG